MIARLSLILLTFVTTASSIALGEHSMINYVEPMKFEESAFKRISQYFGKPENQFDRIIFRTDEATLGGIYFVVRLKDWAKNLDQGTQIELQYYQQGKTKVQKAQFTFPEHFSLTHETYIGVSGNNGPKTLQDILAWKVNILNANGEVLDSDNSYLWDNQ